MLNQPFVILYKYDILYKKRVLMCCNGFRIILLFSFAALSFTFNSFMPTIPVILWYFVSINIFSFLLFIIDKIYAIKDRTRVPESNLHFFTFAGGFIGSFLAMLIARHKIRKKSFILIQSSIAVLWIIAIYYISINIESIQKVFHL